MSDEVKCVRETKEGIEVFSVQLPPVRTDASTRFVWQERVRGLYEAWCKENSHSFGELPNLLLMGPRAEYEFIRELLLDVFSPFSPDPEKGREFWGMKIMTVVGQGDEFVAVARRQKE